eukprot:112711_1
MQKVSSLGKHWFLLCTPCKTVLLCIMFTLLAQFLFIPPMMQSTLIKSVDLTASNTNVSGAQISVSYHDGSASIQNNRFAMDIKSQRGYSWLIHLDNTWGFHPDKQSTISFTMHSNDAYNSADQDLYVTYTTTTDNNYQHISYSLPMDGKYENELNPMCDNAAIPTGDIVSCVEQSTCNGRTRRDEKMWYDDIAADADKYWIRPKNANHPNSWPITIHLTNDPVNNQALTVISTTTWGTFTQSCQFGESMTADSGLNIYIGGDESGEHIEFTKFHLKYVYEVDPTADSAADSTDEPTTSPASTPPTKAPTNGQRITPHPSQRPTYEPSLYLATHILTNQNKSDDDDSSTLQIVIVCLVAGIACVCGCMCLSVVFYVFGISSGKKEPIQRASKVVSAADDETNTVGYTNRNEVMMWMIHTVKLSEYADMFVNNGYDSMRAVHLIGGNTQLLRELGVKNASHRSLILSKIEQLQGNEGTQSSLQPVPSLVIAGTYYDSNGESETHMLKQNAREYRGEGSASVSTIGKDGHAVLQEATKRNIRKHIYLKGTPHSPKVSAIGKDRHAVSQEAILQNTIFL